MSAATIRTYCPDDEEQVIRLWLDCGLIVPANNPRAEIARKTAFQPDLFFVAEMDGRVVATCVAGYEGRRGWINDLGVDPDRRRQGLARRMMEHAEKALRRLGCPKINLQIRESNRDVMRFYRRIGFSRDAALSMGKRLAQDPPHHETVARKTSRKA